MNTTLDTLTHTRQFMIGAGVAAVLATGGAVTAALGVGDVLPAGTERTGAADANMADASGAATAQAHEIPLLVPLEA